MCADFNELIYAVFRGVILKNQHENNKIFKLVNVYVDIY